MIEARFNVERHEYTDPRTGLIVPSNTQVLLANGLIDTKWFKEEHSARGIAVHLACQYLDTVGVKRSSLGELIGYLEAYEKFKKDYSFKPRYTERCLIHETRGYGGTLDREGIVYGGAIWLIDLKSGPVMDWTELQLGGYEPLLPPSNQPRHHFGLQLSKNGKYKLRPFTDHRSTQQFYAELSIYQWRINHGYKVNPETGRFN